MCVAFDTQAPDILLPLARAFERQGTPVLAELLHYSMQQTTLSFKIWSISWTTKQIIYLVGSVMLAVTLAFVGPT